MKTTKSDVEGESEKCCNKSSQDDLKNQKAKNQTCKSDDEKSISNFKFKANQKTKLNGRKEEI